VTKPPQNFPKIPYIMNTFACAEKFVSCPPNSVALQRERQVPLSERSEAEIVQLARCGNGAAFELLYKTYSRRVYGLCLRMTGNPALAEDLTQEAFLQVFRKIHTFRAESAFSTWLYRLTVNIVLMRRRVKSLKETPLEGNRQMEADAPPIREIGRPDARVSGTVDRLNLERAMEQLPRGYRRAFFLHDVLGYEHREIAHALGWSIGTSKSQLHKARTRMRQILGKSG
jgi:RNA polymerase sigma-70 factor (ECF subfamily)